nr:MAG TPA: hypothetical protein [Caudoviricetes sp.]
MFCSFNSNLSPFYIFSVVTLHLKCSSCLKK